MAFFQHSRANNSKVTGLIRPEFELVWDLMPVLVTCASLKKIWWIMNVLAWSHHFPIVVYENFFQCSRAGWSSPVRIWTHLRFYACLGYLQVWRRSDQNWLRKGRDTIFPIKSQWELWLPWQPLFWSSLPQNLMQPLPHPIDARHKIWPRLANWS